MPAMTIEEITAQLEYCRIIFSSGLFSDISSAEEMFALVEAGKLDGKPAFESIRSIRLRTDSLPRETISVPSSVGNAGIVAAIVEKISSAAESQSASVVSVASVASPQMAANSSEMTDKDREDVETYLEWMNHIHDMKSLDRLLFKLKFEEDREHVKAAVRPAFKEASKRVEREEAQKKEAVQPSTATFRGQSALKADGNKDMEGLPEGASGSHGANSEDVIIGGNLSGRAPNVSRADVGQTVDNTVSSSSEDVSVTLNLIVSDGIKEFGYDITPNEQRHMVAKIMACRSAEDLYAAAESINKYYKKHTNCNVLPLLDSLCAARLQNIILTKETAA